MNNRLALHPRNLGFISQIFLRTEIFLTHILRPIDRQARNPVKLGIRRGHVLQPQTAGGSQVERVIGQQTMALLELQGGKEISGQHQLHQHYQNQKFLHHQLHLHLHHD